MLRFIKHFERTSAIHITILDHDDFLLHNVCSFGVEVRTVLNLRIITDGKDMGCDKSWSVSLSNELIHWILADRKREGDWWDCVSWSRLLHRSSGLLAVPFTFKTVEFGQTVITTINRATKEPKLWKLRNGEIVTNHHKLLCKYIVSFNMIA